MLIASFVLGSAACQRIGGRSVTVEFRSAPEVRQGDAVYVAGVRIGEVCRIAVTRGTAQVSVRIDRRHRNALASGMIFLLGRDDAEPGRSCLVGYVLRRQEPVAQSDGVYPGVSSRLELLLRLGDDAARMVLGEISE